MSNLFYQDCAGAYGYSKVAFALEELDYFRSNLNYESITLANRIKRREAERLYSKGLLSDFHILMIRTYVPFIEMYPLDWRKIHKASK